MGIFHSSKLIAAPESATAAMEQNISTFFEKQGYKVSSDRLFGGGRMVSITKGGIFKAVMGLRTSLNIKLIPQNDGILVDASVGIFGQEIIPTMITMFMFWPVILPQIWGLVKQAKLDDKAIALAEEAVGKTTLCTNCGETMMYGGNFCPACGNKIIA